MLIVTLLKGIIVGIVIALPVGPVGLLCVRRTLFEGMTFGLVSGLGAASADTMFGVVAAFGISVVRDALLEYQDWLGGAGGIFLLVMGGRAILRRRTLIPEPLGGEALFETFASAFALTITNPITMLSFAAIFAKIGLQATDSLAAIGVLVGGVFIGSALWWLGLTITVTWMRRRAHAMTLSWLDRGSGVILALSGAGLLVAALLGRA
jgi:threonine/homoserine/homoserine lactone efflux protein